MGENLKIGGVSVENPLFFAPLAGVSVSAVRRFFRRLGVGLTHTEMISSTGLIYGGEKTLRMTEYTPEERPLAIQFFDGDVHRLCQSAELCLKRCRYDALSVNMACPMPKVTRRGAGSRLLQTPEIAADMVRQLKSFGIPVWPKIRKIVPDGKNYPLNTLQFVEELLEAGADTVTIHGRTAQQRYLGAADKDEVIDIAQRFPGRIIATGDVVTAEDAQYYLEKGCAAVLAARGAIANPFMVVQTLRLLGYNKGSVKDDPSLEERAGLLKEFADELHCRHSERVALVLLKRFLPGFFRGKAGTTNFKRALATAQGWDASYAILRGWQSYFERGMA
ncbi:MAG: tRNA dihydrouridine synthase [Pyramidobacter sp.]|jgi:tRNA-dihydrouridine synthase B